MKRRDILRLAGAAAISAPFVTRPAFASSLPLQLIVPFVPGGAVDGLARHFGSELSKELGGRPVVIVNRGGTGGMIGAATVARAAPDGNTVGIIGVGPLCAMQFLFKSMPYNVRTDLQPITRLVDSPLLCVTNTEMAQRNRWNNFGAMMEWAKENPGKYSYASGGIGGAGHLNFAAIFHQLNIDAVHIPYKGGGPIIVDMLAERIEGVFDGAGAIVAHVREGKLKALAVSMQQRFPLLPDVPALSEFPQLDLANHSVNGWHALMAPAGTPSSIVQELNEAAQNVLRSPAFAKLIEPMVYYPASHSGPEMLAQEIQTEIPNFKNLVQAAGIQPT